jgi:hypothetical protein
LGFVIDELPLLGGTYQLEIHVKDIARHKIERVGNLFQFDVVETSVYGGRKLDGWFVSVGLKATAIQKLPSESSETVTNSKAAVL